MLIVVCLSIGKSANMGTSLELIINFNVNIIRRELSELSEMTSKRRS